MTAFCQGGTETCDVCVGSCGIDEYLEEREPQLLGTGLTIDLCPECKHASFCDLAGACLRQEIKT